MTAIPRPASDGGRFLLLTFGSYAALAALAAGLGVFTRLHPAAFGALVAAATLLLALSYAAVPSVRALAERIGPYGLALFHIWRIPAGLVFYAYGASGDLPPVFVALAGTGDILAGAFAALLLVLPRRTGLVAAVHLFGFADFVVAVSTGLAYNLAGHPQMGAIEVLPLALIPLVGVPLSGATHIAALDLLRRGRAA